MSLCQRHLDHKQMNSLKMKRALPYVKGNLKNQKLFNDVCVLCACCVSRGQRGALGPVELELDGCEPPCDCFKLSLYEGSSWESLQPPALMLETQRWCSSEKAKPHCWGPWLPLCEENSTIPYFQK